MNSLNGMEITKTMIICSKNIFNKISQYFMQVVENHYYLNNYMIIIYAKILLMLIMKKMYIHYTIYLVIR